MVQSNRDASNQDLYVTAAAVGGVGLALGLAFMKPGKAMQAATKAATKSTDDVAKATAVAEREAVKEAPSAVQNPAPPTLTNEVAATLEEAKVDNVADQVSKIKQSSELRTQAQAGTSDDFDREAAYARRRAELEAKEAERQQKAGLNQIRQQVRGQTRTVDQPVQISAPPRPEPIRPISASSEIASTSTSSPNPLVQGADGRVYRDTTMPGMPKFQTGVNPNIVIPGMNNSGQVPKILTGQERMPGSIILNQPQTDPTARIVRL